ncbi:hypothetical protein [Brevundimonas sp. R86498]|uniref:hypothetical protein n=1 Tax=Brevundimonas sp. R86498 TaxID=3093845 RepID=UPI0037CB2504
MEAIKAQLRSFGLLDWGILIGAAVVLAILFDGVLGVLIGLVVGYLVVTAGRNGALGGWLQSRLRRDEQRSDVPPAPTAPPPPRDL